MDVQADVRIREAQDAAGSGGGGDDEYDEYGTSRGVRQRRRRPRWDEALRADYGLGRVV